LAVQSQHLDMVKWYEMVYELTVLAIPR